ncbi:MAG TPA: Wzz/FepE/Etk N-terminal domain-containing protein [Candidatus Angelobacter sp.]|nr:Wzz/FepE/Etk N-terminal domain-containing protein [Candidatus Angelobacter sp.]
MSTETERKLTFVIDKDALFNGDKAEGTGDSAGFLELAMALAQRKWFILKMTAGAAVFGAVVALLLPNWYTAETRILPPQQQESTVSALLNSLGSSTGLGAMASSPGRDLLKNPNDLYIGMLKTRPVTDAILRRFDLQKIYGARDVYAARKELASNTEIVSEKEGFINIAVEDKDKKRAAAMVSAYVEELRNLTKELAVTEASQRRLFFDQQLKQAKEDLATAEVALRDAQQKSGVIELDAQAKSTIENVGKLRAEIAVREARLQAVRSFATDQNPEVEMLKSELGSLRGELKKLVKQGGDSDSYEVALKNVPAAGVEYIRAARELKYRSAIFEVLARQYEAAKIDESKNAPLVQVIEPAIEPERKSSPKRTLIVSLCAISGLFLGCIIVFIQRWRSLAYQTPGLVDRLHALRAAALGR